MIFYFLQLFVFFITIVLVTTRDRIPANRLIQVIYETSLLIGTSVWGRTRLNTFHPVSIVIAVLTCINMILLLYRLLSLWNNHEL